MKKPFAILGVLALTLLLTGVVVVEIGCAAKQSPQYNAAVVSNDFAHALASLQSEEISLHNSQVIPNDGHQLFQKAMLEVAKDGKTADALIGQGNWQGAIPLLSSALKTLQGLNPAALHIKNDNSQLVYAAALNAALASLEIKLSDVQTKAAGK